MAAAAFEEWSQSSLSRRAKVLFAFRELATARAGELAELVSAEHGKVLSDARGEVDRGLEVVEFACGIPHLLKGDFSDQASTDVDVFSFRSAARRRRGDHAVQLPGDGPDVDAPGGDRVRQHVHPQAQRARPVPLHARRRAVAGGGAARRRLQRRPGRQGGRRRAARPPRGRGGLLRRLDARSRATCTSAARRPASGCRPWAAPRTTPSCCPTPTSTTRPTTWWRPPSAPPASAAWRSRRR